MPNNPLSSPLRCPAALGARLDTPRQNPGTRAAGCDSEEEKFAHGRFLRRGERGGEGTRQYGHGRGGHHPHEDVLRPGDGYRAATGKGMLPFHPPPLPSTRFVCSGVRTGRSTGGTLLASSLKSGSPAVIFFVGHDSDPLVNMNVITPPHGPLPIALMRLFSAISWGGTWGANHISRSSLKVLPLPAIPALERETQIRSAQFAPVCFSLVLFCLVCPCLFESILTLLPPSGVFYLDFNNG